MKIRFYAFAIVFMIFVSANGLFALGRTETAAVDFQHNEWVLCITAFDVSDLPVARQIMGDLAVRSIAHSIERLDFRLRTEEELAFYRDHAWAQNRARAARALETRRNQRDLLIFQGEPGWRFRRNIQTHNEAILRLEEEMALVNATAPFVASRPRLSLTSGNQAGNFPRPPAPGDERRFAVEQRADAILTGRLSEFHGRLALSVGLYALYAGAFIYEDFVLFSAEDFDAALDEISGRLALAVSGTLPAGIKVHASPENAMLLVDGRFAALEEVHIFSPGTFEIAIYADNHLSAHVPVELFPGELTEVFIDLPPLGTNLLFADVPGSPGSSVFLGGLFVGETPLMLELPRAEFVYISVETPEGEVASMVYKDNTMITGSARFTRIDGGTAGTAIFQTSMPVPPEERRVTRARRGFYGAYGALWIILPVALLTSGVAMNHIAVNNNPQFYSGIHTGAQIAWGTALGVTLFQAFRYLHISSRTEAMPIVRVEQ